MGGPALPEGFAWRRSGRYRAAVREGAVGADLPDPKRLSVGAQMAFSGRGRPVRVTLADGSTGVLREYQHGGLFRSVTRGLFFGSPRPVRELIATERARRAGVAASEVVAAWYRPVAIVFYAGYLLTREVEGARDLVAALIDGDRPGPLLEAVGRETRKMHEAGVWHADLHVKNVLVREGKVTLIDFDRARVLTPVPRSLAWQNLLRFDRSVEKLCRRRGVTVSSADRLRFFRGYYPDGIGRDERAILLRRCQRSLFRHRIAWRIFSR